MSCPHAENIAPGVKLMVMSIPTIVQSGFKAIESGCHYCTFWEFIPQTIDSIAEIIASDMESKSLIVNF